MGAWNTAINGNDTFLDIYQNFFSLYNDGHAPAQASKQLMEDYKEMFDEPDDRNNCLFGLALAQWETKSLEPAIFEQVKGIIETGKDLDDWRKQGADEQTLKEREIALNEFLLQISTEKNKPKRRKKAKFEFVKKTWVNITSPDNLKRFDAEEEYVNGKYIHTGCMVMWEKGGGSVFYFTGEGKPVSARWIDSQTLEITHEKDIIITKKKETFGFRDDGGKVIYIEK